MAPKKTAARAVSAASTTSDSPPGAGAQEDKDRDDGGANKRRRTGAGASRGVANLTPDQLAKKRANDREAQRAIRERTRSQIDTLERRIAELTSQQPYQELQAALRQKELAEAENTEMRRQLARVLGIIQPLVDGGADKGTSASPYHDHAPAYAHGAAAVASAMLGGGGGGGGSTRSESFSPSLPSRQYSAQWQAAMPAQPPPGSLAAVAAESNGGPGPGLSTNQRERLSQLRTTSPERRLLSLMRDDRGVPAGPLPSDSRITLGRDSGSSTPGDGGVPQHRGPRHGPLGSASPVAPPPPPRGTFPHNTLPAHTAALCPLDALLLEFMAERRRLAAAGAPERELIGPHYPDFEYFMSPAEARKARRAEHPLSQLLTDLLQTFPDISDAPEKVATFYGMFLTLRWQVCPTQAHYDRLPAWLRPTSWQVLTPHPVWIDHLPWPEMREELVRNFARYPFDEFFVPFTKTVSVNWPYPHDRIFREGVGGKLASGDDGLELTALFEEHMRDLANWSVGPSFVHTHPLLVSNSVRVTDL